MSRSELVDAYLSGVINRQTFVRGLIGHGLAASVAASYAVALLPNLASGADFYDLYPAPVSNPVQAAPIAPPKKKKKKKRKKKGKDKNKDNDKYKE
jgi:hypothetical protein